MTDHLDQSSPTPPADLALTVCPRCSQRVDTNGGRVVPHFIADSLRACLGPFDHMQEFLHSPEADEPMESGVLIGGDLRAGEWGWATAQHPARDMLAALGRYADGVLDEMGVADRMRHAFSERRESDPS